MKDSAMNSFDNLQTITINRQQGSALAVGLLFLIILTLLGVTASSGAITQELITRNAKDNLLAMQTAEAGLRAAESWIRNNNQPHVDNIDVYDQGFCELNNCLDWTAAQWAANGTPAAYDSTQSTPNDITQAYYVIEIHYIRLPLDSSSSEVYFYKIYSRGTGKSAETVRVLSSIYRY